VKVEIKGQATQRSVLDALEASYPMLRGTIRDHVTQQRRPFLRFFACEEDLSPRTAGRPAARRGRVGGGAPFHHRGHCRRLVPVRRGGLRLSCIAPTAEVRGRRLWQENGRNYNETLRGVSRAVCEGVAPRETLFLTTDHVGPISKIKKRLQEEIDTLQHELSIELPKELAKARAHGDLSENAEYKFAKERQGYVNARITQLKKRMGDLGMLNLNNIPKDRAGYGSRIVRAGHRA